MRISVLWHIVPSQITFPGMEDWPGRRAGDVDHSQGSCVGMEHKCDKEKERKASPRKKET